MVFISQLFACYDSLKMILCWVFLWLCVLGRACSESKDIIVVYRSYELPSVRTELLTRLLQSDYHWKLRARINVATDLPSDFDVLEIDALMESNVRTALLSSPKVKNVYDERAHTRSPKSFQRPSRTPTTTACSPRPSTRWSWDNEVQTFFLSHS